jgi:hypothetical protein
MLQKVVVQVQHLQVMMPQCQVWCQEVDLLV